MKKLILNLLALAIAATIFTGCPKKATIVKEEATAPAVDQKAEAEAKVKTEADERAKIEAEAKTKAVAEASANAEVEAKSETLTEEKFRLKDIHFDFDMYEIRGEYRDFLSDTAEWLSKNKNINLILEGHADDRGNSAYNLALGDRRAQSVMDYLSALGISASRTSTTSYGQEKPVCSEPNEDCWWKNRRVHFVVQEKQ